MKPNYYYLFICLFAGFFLLSCTTTTRMSGEFFDTNLISEIKVGMSQQEVLGILGPPHVEEQYIGGTKWIWSFSTMERDHSFAVRIEEGEVLSRSGYVQRH